ncbi:HIT-like domain [Pseudocohnilembus persalinus]|uniref:HIT-like domain n=1 Tax=Pseudocohnilembus persalinus TaxID=266149 RepID=A0A0V0QDR4_PSEPJ|nr:HIT-like domain [Pseudocohnilembus persalinus]|eukprot:KRX00315.1 HIT-like domain [Pseudocohnilembus persalinus]
MGNNNSNKNSARSDYNALEIENQFYQKNQKHKCIFCQIIQEEQKLIELPQPYTNDEEVIAFLDRSKATAKQHILVCPKKQALLEKEQPNCKKKFGYHMPPYNSVDHLHLHCFILPFGSKIIQCIKYGCALTSTDKLINIINKRNTGKK